MSGERGRGSQLQISLFSAHGEDYSMATVCYVNTCNYIVLPLLINGAQMSRNLNILHGQ